MFQPKTLNILCNRENKQELDRFVIPDKNKPKQYYSYQYEPIDRFHINGNVTKLDTDSQLIKLYKNLLLEVNNKENISYRNQHTQLHEKDVNFSNGMHKHNNKLLVGSQKNQKIIEGQKQFWEYSTTKSDIMSNKFNMDPTKLLAGPSIINKCDRVLEAQSLPDNFYLNLLDCSKKTSFLAVGLSRGIYLWNPKHGRIVRIRDANLNYQSDVPTSLKWHPNSSNILASGTKSGALQFWDVQRQKLINKSLQHDSRIGVLAWGPSCLISGGKDCNTVFYDMRIGKRTTSYRFHEEEICSLGVNSQQQYIASGSNDRNVAVWSMKMVRNQSIKSKKPSMVIKHQAAVKGAVWHPTKANILATGGGTEDRTIRIINTQSNQIVKSYDTGSQICNLIYIDNGRRLVSSHGFNKFETNIWNASTSNLKKQYSLIGHSQRVLYLTADPINKSIITGAGDQTIRFWKLPNIERVQNRKTQNDLMVLR